MKKILGIMICLIFIFLDNGVIADEPDIRVFYNNDEVIFDAKPIIENGRTLVPMRKIFEVIGAKVTWDGKTDTAYGTKDNIEISITIDNNIMTIGDESIILDATPRLIEQRTMIPLRAVSEAFGSEVNWDESDKIVNITPLGWHLYNDREYENYGYYYKYINDLGFSKCSEFSEGLAVVSRSDKNAVKKYFGYTDEYASEFKIPQIYTSATPFKNGFATVISDLYDGEYKIDHLGNIIGDVKQKEIYLEESCNLQLYQDIETKLYGYKNSQGEIIIPPSYDSANEFSEGVARVSNQTSKLRSHDYERDFSFGYINVKGEMVLPFKYMYLSTDFIEGTALVFEYSDDIKGYFIDKGGNKLFGDKKFIDGFPFSEGYAAVQIQGLALDNVYAHGEEKLENVWTYINHEGEFATEKRFERAGSFVDNKAQVLVNGEIRYIDKDFEFIN